MKSLLLLAFASISLHVASQDRAIHNQVPHLITIEGNINRSALPDLMKSKLGLRLQDKLQVIKTDKDELGFVHEKYQQYYKGVKVDGAEYTAHVKGGTVKSISGTFYTIQDLDINPALTKAAALDKAVIHVGAKVYAWEGSVRLAFPDYEKPSGELVIVADEQAGIAPVLAYKFDIYAAKPLYRAYVFINAKTGAFIKEDELIHETNTPATATTKYDGVKSITADVNAGTYRLRQTSSGGGVETYSLRNGTSYTGAVGVTSTSASFTSDPTANSAHYGAEQTHSYYLLKHGRNSYNNAGAVLRSYVHYSTNYVNAFWDGSRMTYGDGNGTTAGPLVSLDICGHELTHGVTGNTSRLTYSYESGALNESFSDIFGEAIENYARGSNDWLMGNDIKLNTGKPFRSMINPNQFSDPDTYKGLYWYTGTGDNGGVHTNSGVQNKWFYILSQGETGTNDIGSTYSVTGIGLDDAARIAYRNLTVYLSSSSNYQAARNGAIQAAIDIFGAGSPQVIATTNAWYAVGVGCEYGTSCYCPSAASSASSMWIQSFTVGSFTNSSGAAGYSDFLSKVINLDAGNNYNVTLMPGFSGGVYNVYWKVWIDYNKDGDFEDAGELAFSKGLTNTTATGSVAVPPGVTGETRMRVSMKYNAAQSSCETFSNGEVEDYTVVMSNIPDIEAPSAPVLSPVGSTHNSISVSWTPSTDNRSVSGYDVYVDGILKGSTNTTTFVATGLSPATTYNVYVVAKDGAGNTATSNSISMTTSSFTSTVLLAHYFETGWDGWISGGGNTSRYSGNRSYEGQYSISLKRNSSAYITSPAKNVSSYNQLVIDFYFYATGMENGDDLWVRYYNGSGWTTVATFAAGTHFTNNGFYHATVTLNTVNYPVNAQFRIQLDGNDKSDLAYIDAITIRGNAGGAVAGANQKSCTAATPANQQPSPQGINQGAVEAITKVSVFPNPASGFLIIEAPKKIESLLIYNMEGKLVKSIMLPRQNKLSIAELSAGSYILKIRVGDEWMTSQFIKR